MIVLKPLLGAFILTAFLLALASWGSYLLLA